MSYSMSRVKNGLLRISASGLRGCFRAGQWLILLFLAGCATIYNPATERRETILDSSIETALGNLAKVQMGLTSLHIGKVQPEQLARVQKIGARIARVSDRQDITYQFGVIQEKSWNAFTLPGATIYVHTGILEHATDEELAAVIAHEVGHVAARHVVKHLQADLGFTALLQIAHAAGLGGASAQLANSLYDLLSRGFSQQDELEADRLSIRYTDRAGYPPEALIGFFDKLLKQYPENSLEKAAVWQSTHPLTNDRIARAKEEIARLGMERPMFCPVCGRRFDSKARFCEHDGTPLRKKRQVLMNLTSS